MEYEGDYDTYCNWCTGNDPQRLGIGAGRVRNQSTSRDHPNYSIVEIGQNTEKSIGELRRLAVTQTPVKDHQLTLMRKTCKEFNNNNNNNKERQIPWPYKGIEKIVEHESDVYTNCTNCSWYNHRRIIDRTEEFGNKRTSGNHPNYYTLKIGQNPGYLFSLKLQRKTIS